jgi:hypothetical protein
MFETHQGVNSELQDFKRLQGTSIDFKDFMGLIGTSRDFKTGVSAVSSWNAFIRIIFSPFGAFV